MPESGLVELIVRMVVSLGAVLGVIAVAFAIARRRVNSGGFNRTAIQGRRKRSNTPPIEVVGRAGLSRGSMAIAIRFGDSVILVGVSEQAPTTVLQEMDAQRWDELQNPNETVVPIATATGAELDDMTAVAATPNSIIQPRPTFLEALRDATSRRA